MHRFATIRDKELRAELTPDYDFGCKRPTFSNGYYRSFTKPHVHLQDSGIDRIEPDGIVANDGTKTVIDTLVLATGFDLWEANFPAIEIDRARRPQSRKVVARHPVPGLPGCVDAVLPELPEPGQPVRVPRAELLQHDGIPDAATWTGCSARCNRRGATTFEVSEEANTRYLDRMTELLGDSLFTHRQLRHVAVLLLQPQRRADAAAADDHANRDQGSLRVPPERLSD